MDITIVVRDFRLWHITDISPMEATSAFGGLTDITIVVLEFAYDPIRKLEESME